MSAWFNGCGPFMLNVFGRPRIHEQLTDEGESCSYCRAERLMIRQLPATVGFQRHVALLGKNFPNDIWPFSCDG